jgi:uncharacterized radical SAM superfamily protein
MNDMHEKLARSREISWAQFGKKITFFLPGIFRCAGVSGKYPAVSITGDACVLNCKHCRGLLLRSMIPALTPDLLVEKCLHLSEQGAYGVLISGGCDESGRLPWTPFIPAIQVIKTKTNLLVSIHSGLVDRATAVQLKNVGVDQTLIDVIGDDETCRDIYRLDGGVSRILSSMEAFQEADLPMVPHIVCGLHYGRMNGEERAIDMISRFHVEQVVIVSFMKLQGKGPEGFVMPDAEEVAGIIAEARLRLPNVLVSLGCARERGNTKMEILAIEAGVNHMALPSEEAVERARTLGLGIEYRRTCCSVRGDFPDEKW